MRLFSTAIIIAVGLSVTACGSTTANRSVNSERQPVVTRSHYAIDLNISGSGELSNSEQNRLSGWFDALELGYGDRIAIDDPAFRSSGSTKGSVESLVAEYGLLLSDTAPVTDGNVAPGSIRVVVSRSSASVPGCPDWSQRSHTDFQGRTSPGYGCAINGTMAAMIADPEDLVRGQQANGEDQSQASKAIRAYRDKQVGGN